MKYKFKPHSNNIIFFDTEFSSNDHVNAELLSLGMVKYSGEELYMEFKHDNKVSGWVRENVLPHLNDEKVSRKVAINKIEKFVGNNKPYLVAFVYPFDYLLMDKLFGWDELQKLFHWPPIDFASILFGNDIDPETYYPKDENNFFKQIGIDREKFGHTHNALDDAKLLREVYLRMTK